MVLKRGNLLYFSILERGNLWMVLWWLNRHNEWLWLVFFFVIGVWDCMEELKVMYLVLLVLVMASMTAMEVALFGTLNSMILRWTDVKDIEGDWDDVWLFCVVLHLWNILGMALSHYHLVTRCSWCASGYGALGYWPWWSDLGRGSGTCLRGWY